MPMNYVESLESKIQIIRSQFKTLIGKTITGYEFAEMWHEEDNEWSEWMDLPVFLRLGNEVISISWFKFDALAIETGRVLPFSLCGSTVRWTGEGHTFLDLSVGKTVSSVSIGRGQMTVADSEIEIWTRLLIGFECGQVLEIFNALDENGVEFHKDLDVQEFTLCT